MLWIGQGNNNGGDDMTRRSSKEDNKALTEEFPILSDVLGSYTGRCADPDEHPVQDADDL